MYHYHHIIPRHAGGTDDPSNLVKLTVAEHAEAHRKLYEEHGRWQDRIAWHTLSGQIGKEEAIRQAQSEGQKNRIYTEEHRQALKDGAKKRVNRCRKEGTPTTWNDGHTKHTHPSLKKVSENSSRQMSSGEYLTIGDRMRGKKFTEEHKEVLRQRALNRQKIECEYCGKKSGPAMHKRWHGESCKAKV